MSNKKVQLKIDVDIIDEETFAEHYTEVFSSYLAEERTKRCSTRQGLEFVVSTNPDKYLNAVYIVAIDKDDDTHREEFVWLLSKPYNSGFGNKYIKVTGCNSNEILLKVLAVC